MVAYTWYFPSRLTEALDAFHSIQRELKVRVRRVLGQDSPNWRIKNSCRVCTYKLENEPPLKFDILVTCDGNDSLKQCANAGTADHRHYESDYYIAPAEVNRFQYEVAGQRKGKKTQKQAEQDAEETMCKKRWKNAKIQMRPSDDNSKPRTIFHETGIFASTCCHAFVMTMCDMIRAANSTVLLPSTLS
ncbi:hypothetical protein FRC12_019340 [Ceratobasidium sp. 428]|nr:hypothetical protein FRC12_019340 [Ceratobasidium sp. 428]